MHELKMAVVALEACIRKVFWWNNSFTTVAIFLHTIELGESDLAAYSDRLTVLADFIDEIIKSAIDDSSPAVHLHYHGARPLGAPAPQTPVIDVPTVPTAPDSTTSPTAV